MPSDSPNRFRIARDYNRGLAGPVRALHVAWAAIGPEFSIAWRWMNDPARRWWALPTLWAILAFIILFPLDGPISHLARAYPPGGDIQKELAAWQQYGAIGSLLLTALLIFLLDPARRRRLLDLFAAAFSAWFLCQILKIAIGRPRPKFDDPGILLTPFGAYPLGPDRGVRHAWELWSGISTDLWSLPSSHTASAAALSIFLLALYPRLRPLCITLVCIVGIARIWFISHWPSDVAVGAAVGVIAATAAVNNHWGQRLWAWLLIRTGRPATAYTQAATPLPVDNPTLPAKSQPSQAENASAAS